jgi:hypothetical protein
MQCTKLFTYFILLISKYFPWHIFQTLAIYISAPNSEIEFHSYKKTTDTFHYKTNRRFFLKKRVVLENLNVLNWNLSLKILSHPPSSRKGN